jgi:hypothetical protein
MAMTMTKTEEGDFPNYEWTVNVCKLGMGKNCCRYLAVDGGGWSCLKHSTLKAYIDNRVATKKMRATGDNCPGKDAR